MNSNSMTSFLRPEARPFNWSLLNRSQQEAFRHIVAAMGETVKATSRRELEDAPSRLDPFRSNQTLLVTGDRGMGKSSLLLSLQQFLMPEGECVGTGTESGLDNDLRDDIHKLRGRIVWLETLDMEPLPGPTNLLVSILARIEHAVGRVAKEDGLPRGLLNPVEGTEAAFQKLRRLTTDASLTWDGNIKERAASLDPDMFAHEVMRAEQSRLSINSRFSEVLEDLAAGVVWGQRVEKPIFVLPIDDFDLNPVRCLGLLRLIRAITVPRLVTLILGDFGIAEQAFKLKMAADFARVGNIQLDANDLYQTEFFSNLVSVSGDALRKLLPPAQRIALKALTPQESLDYRPEIGQSNLRDVLRHISILLELPLANPESRTTTKHENADSEKQLSGHEHDNLEKFLLAGPIKDSPADRGGEERFVYTCSSILQSPPRVIADLWLTLSRDLPPFLEDESAGNPNVSRDRLPILTQAVREWTLQAIINDSNLLYREKNILRSAIEPPPGRTMFFRTDSLAVDWGESTPRRWVSGQSRIPPETNYRFRPQETWQLFLKETTTKDREPPKATQALDTNTRGYICLLHDLVALSKGPPISGRWLIPEIGKLKLATCTWTFNTESFRFSWPGGTFRCFRELDQFFDCWNHSLDSLTSPTYEQEVEDLAVYWMGATASLLLGEPFPWHAIPGEKIGDIEKKATVESVIRCINLNDAASANTNFGEWRRRHMMLNFVVLLAPEYGIPSDFAQMFFADDRFLEFCKKECTQIRRTRAYNSRHVFERRQNTSTYYKLIASPKGLLSEIGKRSSHYVSILTRSERKQSKDQSKPSKTTFNKLCADLEAGRLPLKGKLREFRSHLLSASNTRYGNSSEFLEATESIDELITYYSLVKKTLTHPVNGFMDGVLCLADSDF